MGIYSLLAKASVEPVHHERRKLSRFPIQRAVSYRQGERAGAGRTIDISSGGVLFAADEPPLLGERIELYVDWPAALDHRVRLKLSVAGRVVRVQGKKAAIAIDRYEFRTAGPKQMIAKPL